LGYVSSTMETQRALGNKIAPPRFLAFIAILVIGVPLGHGLLGNWALGAMSGFDAAALFFLLSCISLLGTKEARVIREHAQANDANRLGLLIVSLIVVGILMIAIAAEAVGKTPQPFTKVLIIFTLGLAWLFANTIYALHYAHLVYIRPEIGCVGLEFPRTEHPVYWDFVYFAWTCGMAFATSDVIVTETHMRKTVAIHCLAAFAFNIGVLAFTINLLASSG
jgi:uncharacterized membrane protein